MRRLLLLGLLLLVLGGCGSVAPPAVPTARAAATAVAQTGAMVMPGVTPTVTLTGVAPTSAARPSPAPTAPLPPPPSGTARFVDKAGPNDAMVVTVANAGRLADGMALEAWLTGGNDTPGVQLGRIPLDGDGKGEATLVPNPPVPNLLARFNGVMVTVEPAGQAPAAPSARMAFAGQLSGDALAHIRHLLVAADETPGSAGQALGLRKQVEILDQHIHYQSVALANKNLYEVRWHAEHLVNIIDGKQGAHYGDLFKDGQVQNPGDGYGLLENGDQLGYIAGVAHYASLAAAVPGAGPELKQHGEALVAVTANLRQWVGDLEQNQLAVVQAQTLAEAEPGVRQSGDLDDRIVNGADANGNGIVETAGGEGGMLAAYREAELMATIVLTPDAAFAGAAAAAGPATPSSAAVAGGVAAAPTTTAAPPAGTLSGPVGTPTPATGLVTIEMRDSSFGGPVTIRTGTTVVWVNRDGVTHTVTADRGEFASEILKQGDTFGFTFTKAGTYPYYCELHGSSGGAGMASTIVVVP